MPLQLRAPLCVTVAIWSIAACSDVTEPAPGAPAAPMASASASASPSAAPPSAASTTPAQQSAAAGSAAPTAMAPSRAPTSSGTTPGAPAASPGDPATPAEPVAMPEAMDACSERKVSYSQPCHNDPDPCGLKSGWEGDKYCLPKPEEGKGIQIHIGPDDYTNEAEVAKYVIQPGEEFNNSVLGHIPLTEAVFWNHMTASMRPGSHHWISTVVDGKPEEKFYDDTGCGGATSIGSIGGGQNLIYDNPPMGIQAPENKGLGRSLEGNSSLCMNLHAYNFTDKPMLREMWINLYTVPEEEVTQRAAGIGLVGGLGLNLAPGESLENTYEATFAEDGRIIQLFGHRHVWTPRFAVWLNENLIYDSWLWEESVTYNYDSITMNPPINTPAMTDGAVSGMLPVKAGDVLKFTCFIKNEGDVTLRFSNELKGGEMCNLWGSAVGGGLSGSYF
jgi:hypothetical protein